MEDPLYFPGLVEPIKNAVSIEQVRAATDEAASAIAAMPPYEAMQFCADVHASMPPEKAMFVLGRITSRVEDLCKKS